MRRGRGEGSILALCRNMELQAKSLYWVRRGQPDFGICLAHDRNRSSSWGRRGTLEDGEGGHPGQQEERKS